MTLKLFRRARIYTPTLGAVPAAGAEQGRIRSVEDGAFLVEAH